MTSLAFHSKRWRNGDVFIFRCHVSGVEQRIAQRSREAITLNNDISPTLDVLVMLLSQIDRNSRNRLARTVPNCWQQVKRIFLEESGVCVVMLAYYTATPWVRSRCGQKKEFLNSYADYIFYLPSQIVSLYYISPPPRKAIGDDWATSCLLLSRS